LETGYLDYAEGSVLISMGSTRVLCAASVEERVPRWMRGTGRGWITAEYALMPRSTQSRTQRESVRGRIKGRTHEISRLIGRSLRAAFDLDLLGERMIIVDCDVIQADGGTRTASVTGGYVALALAIGELVRNKLVPSGIFEQAIAAISVGIVDGQPLLDLDYEEDSRADADVNVVMDADGRLIEIQGTAEGAAFSRTELDQLLDLADKGIRELLQYQQEAIDRDQA
jgi:ribonuclease PH